MKSRMLKIEDCFYCYYYVATPCPRCVLADREIFQFDEVVPGWCPLPPWNEKEDED